MEIGLTGGVDVAGVWAADCPVAGVAVVAVAVEVSVDVGRVSDCAVLGLVAGIDAAEVVGVVVGC